MRDIENIERKLYLGKYGSELSNYYGLSCSISIDEAIEEIARENVDIYTDDLMDFLKEHVEDVEYAIQSYGWDGVGKSLSSAAQMAEEEVYRQEIFDHLDDVITNYILDTLKGKGFTEVDEKWLAETAKKIDRDNSLEDIDKYVDEYVEECLPSLEEKTADAKENETEELEESEEHDRDEEER